ncbi:MAG: protein kinase [Lentisphaeria bacterium]|nr:protein kinase [Lentisphaeria bacterium]
MATAADTTALREGDFLGPYRLVRHLARGAHWDVYLARSGAERRQVVLKLPLELHEPPAAFLERARAAARVEHPNLARIYAVGEDRGRLYIAQELVADPRGVVTDLDTERLNHGGCLPEQRVRILAKHILDGLAAARQAPGEGLVHGHLRADKILLNEQRRAKLIDTGLLTAACPGARERDDRCLAAILYALLTGRDLGPQSPLPSALGANPRWDRLVKNLLTPEPTAAGKDLGRLAEELALIDTAPGHRWAWLLPVAATLLLAAAAVVAVAVVRARQQRRETLRAQAREQAESSRNERLAAALEQAVQALASADHEAALRHVDEALVLDPQSPRALRLQGDIRLAEGMARVRDVKERADASWAAVEEIDPGQGLGETREQTRTALAAARQALSEMAFEQAAALFRQAAENAEALAVQDRRRRAAAAARQSAEAGRDGADLAHADDRAAELWEEAETAHRQALARFENGDFTQAEKTWHDAAAVFARAGNQARGANRLSVAENAFREAVAAAGEDARGAMPKEIRDRVLSRSREALECARKEQWDEAAKGWEDALAAFQEGLGDAERVLARHHFDQASKRGRELLDEGRFAMAERAFEEALGVKGYGGDRAVQGLLAEARKKQGTRPRRTGNLVLNGDFSAGEEGVPAGWTEPDRLTVFWEDGGVTGKCLRMDTDVYRREWEEHRRDPHVPRRKTPTTGTRYDTVGGTTGVAVYCRPIDVAAGACYRVRYDVQGQGEPFLYMKGYWKCGPEHLKELGEKIFFQPVPGGPSYSLVAFGTSGEEKRQPRAGDYIQSFRRRLVARFPDGKAGAWRRFETVLQLPPDRPIEKMLLELYAFWPPGEYRFDNVSMEEVTEAELQAYEAQRQQRGEEANFGVPPPSPNRP